MFSNATLLSKGINLTFCSGESSRIPILNLYGEDGHSNDCGGINLTLYSGESSRIPMLSLYGEDGHSNDCGGINLTLYSGKVLGSRY